MTPIEHSENAMHRLILARIAGNVREINYWQARLDYWTERVIENDRETGKRDLISCQPTFFGTTYAEIIDIAYTTRNMTIYLYEVASHKA